TREIFSTQFSKSIKQGVQYYVAMYYRNDTPCDNDGNNYLCLTDGLGMRFLNARNDISNSVMVNEIIDSKGKWILKESCYTGKGDELRLQIGHFKTNENTMKERCVINDTFNYGYFYIDDIIVEEFDLVPDTIYVCEDSILRFDLKFHDVQLYWDDGIQGGKRLINSEGMYTILGKVGSCTLMDQVSVIVLKKSDNTQIIEKCKLNSIDIRSNLPYVMKWDNGTIGSSIFVRDAGQYTAIAETQCGEITYSYIVRDVDCLVEVHAPNVINLKTWNSKINFFIESTVAFEGELSIYDRYGNKLFAQNSDNMISWDPYFNGVILKPQVLVWVFIYIINNSSEQNMVKGNLTILE
ncbi:MAG TPA: hypothetical protein PKD85_09710, partial [Saprospiraceae bacterium]|nr:hypothetical protein [Saprospiraceae bacterium]